MGHEKKQPDTVLELAEHAREAARELHTALADYRRETRLLNEQIDAKLAAVRVEIGIYSRDVIAELLQRIADEESAEFVKQVRAASIAAQTQVAAACEKLFERYMQQEIDDAPDPADMFEARRTLARWQKNIGSLPVVSLDEQGNLIDDQGRQIVVDSPLRREPR